MNQPKNIALAMTGASGAPYFLRLLERLQKRDDVALHLIASEGGRRVLQEESQIGWPPPQAGDAEVYQVKNIGARLASGSFRLQALVVIPCSMHSMAAMASGLAANLVHRTAACQLKESRQLIVVPRETPLSLINLRAMTALKEAGAIILPDCPGFYHQPETIQDLVDTVVDRVIDHLDLDDPAIKRWSP